MTLEGTVERTDPFSRALTLRTSDSTTQTINVPRELKLFDELRARRQDHGARVRIGHRHVRPGREAERRRRHDGERQSRRSVRAERGSLQQLKAAVTVESVDRSARVIVYKTADSRKVIRAVADPQLLEGLKAGDVIEITYTRERAIDLQRARLEQSDD